jgi:hypothetical protein
MQMSESLLLAIILFSKQFLTLNFGMRSTVNCAIKLGSIQMRFVVIIAVAVADDDDFVVVVVVVVVVAILL